MRGALPLLNRLGQSLPPLLAAGFVRRQPQKKWICCASVALMSAMFVGLATIWAVPDLEKHNAAPLLFLLCYGLFFVFLGINQLAQLTLQGKLLLATRRGRLLSVSNGVGAVTSVACAVLLLPLWLRETSGDFEHLFFFTAALFAAGGIVTLFLVEPHDRRLLVRHRLRPGGRSEDCALLSDAAGRGWTPDSARPHLSLLYPG